MTSTEKPRRAPTLRDVAHAAGVSIWTASNTFSNPHRVAAATRQRVLEAADRLDYAGPNPSARTLALGRTQMVALWSDADARDFLADPVASLITQGLVTACDGAGLAVVIAGRAQDLAVDGYVRYRPSGEGPVRGRAVAIDATSPRDDQPNVSVDMPHGVQIVAHHLRALGHRRIAVLSTPELTHRLGGLTPGDIGEHVIVYESRAQGGWPDRAAGEASARAALGADPRPSALLALSDSLALGALEAVHRLGLQAPRDISVTGMDDVPGADAAGLTTLMVPHRPMGELAGETLIQMISGETPPPPPELPVALAIRRTTAPPAEPTP